MFPSRRRLVLALSLLAPLSACGSSPDSLAQQVQAAFEKGDMDGAMELASFEGSPEDLHFFYLDQVGDCGQAATVCTVQVQPLDDEFTSDTTQAEAGMHYAVAPEGLLVLSARAEDGKSRGTMRMPYARVGGDYRLLGPSYTAAKLAEMRAATVEQQAERLFQAGIYDPERGERRTDWKDTATALPADGGAAGAWLVARTQAMAQAAAANDPDAAMKAGGQRERIIFGDKDYEGKPVPLAERKAKLRAQAARMLREIKVLGGWERGDEAVLMAEGVNGIGWQERAAYFLSKDETDGWSVGGTMGVSFPPGN